MTDVPFLLCFFFASCKVRMKKKKTAQQKAKKKQSKKGTQMTNVPFMAYFGSATVGASKAQGMLVTEACYRLYFKEKKSAAKKAFGNAKCGGAKGGNKKKKK